MKYKKKIMKIYKSVKKESLQHDKTVLFERF